MRFTMLTSALAAALALFGSAVNTAVGASGYTSSPSVGSTPFQVVSLTTEYLDSPLGVDVVSPRVSWKVVLSGGGSASAHPRRGVSQSSYRIQLSSPNFAGEIWDCGIVSSSDSTLVALTAKTCNGWTPKSDACYSWNVEVILDDGSAASATSTFRTGLLRREDWRGKWITGGNVATLLRSAFDVPGTVKSHATLFVSGIGYHEVYLNGWKVGNHVLDQGWTDYAKRVWYSTHDVTDLLLRGQRNAVGVSLGNGWWSCGPPPGTAMRSCSEEDPPQVLLQIQVDGEPVLFTQSENAGDEGNGNKWAVSPGPIIYNSLYRGETYDGRVAEALGGWATASFDASRWNPASVADSVANGAVLSSQLFEPIRHISTRAPINVSAPKLGVQVIDFGQNMAAVVRLKRVFCDRGRNVTIRHAETLMHPPFGPRDGNIYIDNLLRATATDMYICRGDPEGESYTPTFTQHGFRYAEVTGLSYPLQEEDVEMVELHTDIRPTSSIVFSAPLLNEIQRMVLMGQKSNVMSVPTDCPQRSERYGWMGDAALVAEEAAHNFAMGAFFSRWAMQIADAQADDGSVPNYVPSLDQNGGGSPNWQSAYPQVLRMLVSYYGDRDVAAAHHDSLVAYYNYFQGIYNESGISGFPQGFGDWVPPLPHPISDKRLTGAFALVHDLRAGVEIFGASRHEDAPAQMRRCATLVSHLLGEFHGVFFNAVRGFYRSGIQTEQALPLRLGVVPENVRDGVLSHLINDIQVTNSGHTTCGIIGIKFLMETLTEHGRSDVALDLALQTTYPSWGYMLRSPHEPATTVWELWNSDTAGPSMNSRNHIMFGSVSGWFYKCLAGITPARPGYRDIRVRPTAVGHANLTHVEAKVVTPHGDIISSWKLEHSAGAVVYSHALLLPPGTKATLSIPLVLCSLDAGQVQITESNIVVWANGTYVPGIDGISSGTMVGDSVEFRLANGRYYFRSFSTASFPILGRHEIN